MLQPKSLLKETKEALSDSRASSYYIIGENSPFRNNNLNIIVVEDNETKNIIGYDIKFLITRGHTTGSTTFVIDSLNAIFSGDTLFKGTWGRTDLPTSSLVDIMDSITKKLLVLPEETIVYPGHGKITRVREEKPIYY